MLKEKSRTDWEIVLGSLHLVTLILETMTLLGIIMVSYRQ
jgi:hypothetical protein